MKILPQLLAILSSLQGYAANRPSGARHAAAGSGGISMSFGLRVKQETQMRQTCITLAITTLIPITASASGLTYSESRLSYQSQESNSNTARRANLNVGFEAGANQYGLRYIHRSSDNNPSSQEANITFGSHVADRLFVEGMVSAEKGDTYDNRGYGFRTEYDTTLAR